MLSRSDILNLIPSWELHLRASNLAPTTISNYVLAVRQFTEFMEERRIDHASKVAVQGFLRAYLDGYSPATARQKLVNLQIFYRWAVEEGEVGHDITEGVKAPKQIEQEVPLISEAEIDRLLKSCGNDEVGKRDQAIITLLTDTGIRLSELVNLKWEDIDFDLLSITVLAKGRRLRTVPITARAARALDRVRRSQEDGEHVWLGQRGPMTSSGVSQMLAKRGKRVLGYRIHAHQFRHSFAHQWMSDGGNPTDLERLMGWRSPHMVRRYGSSAADQRAWDSYRQLRGEKRARKRREFHGT